MDDSMGSVDRPAHYAGDGVVSCDDAIASMVSRVQFRPGDGNVISHKWQAAMEYLWRWPMKNGAEDLRKAQYVIGQMADIVERCDPFVEWGDVE